MKKKRNLSSSVHKLCSANLSKPQAGQIPAGMGAFLPNTSVYAQAPGAWAPGGLAPNQQSYGLYPQPGGHMPQPHGQGMGYPGHPGQPMPGYPRAPSPNPPMAGYGGAPAPMPAYPKVPSPNPSVPGYGGGVPGGSTMPIAPPVNVNNLFVQCLIQLLTSYFCFYSQKHKVNKGIHCFFCEMSQ